MHKFDLWGKVHDLLLGLKDIVTVIAVLVATFLVVAFVIPKIPIVGPFISAIILRFMGFGTSD